VWHDLALDHVRSGPSPDTKDAIIYDIDATGVSKSGFGHPKCNGKEADIAIDIGAGTGRGVLP
jgi:hypothetical protein